MFENVHSKNSEFCEIKQDKRKWRNIILSAKDENFRNIFFEFIFLYQHYSQDLIDIKYTCFELV